MIRESANILRSSWKSLILTDILFKVIAFILLTPLVSLLLHGFLAFSGRTAVADTDIANFLLHPLGWTTLIAAGAATIGILALEQSTLMAIVLATTHGKRLSVLSSLRLIARKSSGVFQITAWMTASLLVLAAPFVVAAGGLYFWLLTNHDINYYLTKQPPRFWFAAALIGVLLAAMVALLIQRVVSWSIAIQLWLFENVSPRACLSLSRERVHGRRKLITTWVVAWILANLIVSFILSAILIWAGSWIAPGAQTTLWRVVLRLGFMLMLWSVVNFVTSLLSAVSFALLQGQVYERFGRSQAFRVPADDQQHPRWAITWTRGRLLSGLLISVLIAALVGVIAILSVRLEDRVQITGHRGGAGNAPENTLAAMQRAIEDKADWVEIDVQESKDGIVMVAHDSDLKKVGGADIRIWEGTAEELRAIDIGSSFAPKFKGEKVPTLAEVLEACRGKIKVNIELKYYGHNQNLEQKVIDLVEEHGMASDIVIMSLKSEGIKKVKALRPTWTVGLLTAVAFGDLTTEDADFLAVSTKLATRSFIQSAHRHGKQVYAWTVNDPLTMSTMISRGADNLITDRPDLARHVLSERAEMSLVERVLLEFTFLFGTAPRMSSDE